MLTVDKEGQISKDFTVPLAKSAISPSCALVERS